MGIQTTSRQQFDEQAAKLRRNIQESRRLADLLISEDGGPDARRRAKRIRMGATRDERWLERFTDMLDAEQDKEAS